MEVLTVSWWKPLNTLFIFIFFFGARCLQDVSRYYGFLSRTKLLFESVSSFQFCGDFAHCLCVEEEGPSWIPWKEQTCESHGGRRLRLACFDIKRNVPVKSPIHPPPRVNPQAFDFLEKYNVGQVPHYLASFTIMPHLSGHQIPHALDMLADNQAVKKKEY